MIFSSGFGLSKFEHVLQHFLCYTIIHPQCDLIGLTSVVIPSKS